MHASPIIYQLVEKSHHGRYRWQARDGLAALTFQSALSQLGYQALPPISFLADHPAEPPLPAELRLLWQVTRPPKDDGETRKYVRRSGNPLERALFGEIQQVFHYLDRLDVQANPELVFAVRECDAALADQFESIACHSSSKRPGVEFFSVFQKRPRRYGLACLLYFPDFHYRDRDIPYLAAFGMSGHDTLRFAEALSREPRELAHVLQGGPQLLMFEMGTQPEAVLAECPRLHLDLVPVRILANTLFMPAAPVPLKKRKPKGVVAK